MCYASSGYGSGSGTTPNTTHNPNHIHSLEEERALQTNHYTHGTDNVQTTDCPTHEAPTGFPAPTTHEAPLGAISLQELITL
jgi:hypothetical protein